MLFTVGPLIAAATIAVISPIAALALSAACTIAGVALFVSQPPSRNWKPHEAAGTHGRLGALRSRGVVTLMASMLPTGFCFGVIEISLPAFSKQFGAPEWAGLLLSVWALASAVGGLWYGARNWRLPLPSVYLRLAALLPLGFLPALLAPSIAAMALLIIPAGLLIAPLGAAGNQLVGQVAPEGAVTEAYAWPVTAMIAGFAVGTATGGALVRRLALARIPRGRRSLRGLGRAIERAGARWDGRLLVATVDLATGRRVVFGAPGAPAAGVGEAVEASCAIPGVFRPIAVNGRSYVDGGAWSPTNMDVASVNPGARVLCLNPTASLRPTRESPFGALGPVSRAVAALEALTLERRGARVRTVAPDRASSTALGTNFMDPRRRDQVIEAGVEQGRALELEA
jgi:NTE family protein